MDLRKLTRIQDSAKDAKLELASKFEDKLTQLVRDGFRIELV